MSEKLIAWNAFDYMDTEEEINTYLLECFNDEDPRVFIHALGDLAKKRGMTEVAEAVGVNRESLYKSFSGDVSPRWDTVRKVMAVLNVNLSNKVA